MFLTHFCTQSLATDRERRRELLYVMSFLESGRNFEASLAASYDLHLKVQSTSEETEVWILLTRHVSDTRAVTEFVAVHAQIRDSADDVGALQVAKQVLTSLFMLRKQSYIEDNRYHIPMVHTY
jgi:hypothetical protein